ncbi:MAG: ferredoxin [Porticoccaceae bacterium]
MESDTGEINAQRKMLLQMLFVEGNHFCPSCEKSGNCLLQATAYQMGMEGPHFEEFYPDRPVDASHPDILLDFNRCILCELCVRASRDLDGKNLFAIGGHGIGTQLLVNSASGRLGDTDMALDDRAASICPVGVILPKRRGFAVPIGQRRFDLKPVSQQVRRMRMEKQHDHKHPVAALAPAAQAQGGHRLAGRLLWLPHVLPRHRQTAVRADRAYRVRPFALHRHQGAQPV